MLAGLLAAFPGVQAWWGTAWAGVQKHGWIATAAGRRWPLPGVARMAPRVSFKVLGGISHVGVQGLAQF